VSGSFLQELKQRRVVRVAIGYAIAAWLIVQIASTVLPTFHVPEWVLQALIVVVALGFPAALVLAWAFDVTPTGIEKTAEGTGLIAAKNRRHGWLLAGFGVLVAVATVGAYWLWHTSNSTERHGSRVASIEKGGSASSALPANEKSIAVLPFKSLSEDKANNYFADGIQDEILTRLSKIADLKVISRTSTQKYQSSPENLREIAQQLGVTNVLEGSVQKAGEQVRITVQLINAVTDAHLWAETYDRKLTDIFGVESEVAQRIASSLEARLSGHEREQLANVPTRNPQAYDAYLRGMSLRRREGRKPREEAIEIFRQAVALDPSYAQAWAALSIAESEEYFSPNHTQAQLERARDTAETAMRLQPDLADAHLARGSFYYYCLQDFDRALAEIEEARNRSPNNADVIVTIGFVKRRQGKIDESIELLKQATVLDPQNSATWAALARTYRGKRDFKMAREIFDRAHAISPEENSFLGEKSETYVAEGDLEAAEGVLRGQELRDGSFFANIALLQYRRRFKEAATELSGYLRTTKAIPPQGAIDLESWLGFLTALNGGTAAATHSLEESRKELQALRDKGDMSLRVSDDLIFTTALLGRREEVARQAAELLSTTQRDLWRAPKSEEQVAAAYAVLGDADHALPLLRHALSVPYDTSVTPALLRFDAAWDKIRNDPRFQKLAEGK
jgi:TolB-like protein/Tfp pilus assembly protein PilF